LNTCGCWNQIYPPICSAGLKVADELEGNIMVSPEPKAGYTVVVGGNMTLTTVSSLATCVVGGQEKHWKREKS
jgi:hypothetical protein